MARSKQAQRVSQWKKRIERANRAYEDWETDYECSVMEDYRKGFQWDNRPNVVDPRDRYMVNLIFSTIETRLPSNYFFNPRCRIQPKPARGDDPMSQLQDVALIMEDTAYTFMSNEQVAFEDHIALAILDSFARFGIIEVGYTANYIDNPHAKKPMLTEDVEYGEDGKLSIADGVTRKKYTRLGGPQKGELDEKRILKDFAMRDEEGARIMEPDQLPKSGSEQLYVRWIDAKRFRAGSDEGNRLDELDWYGYFEWVQLEDIKNNPAYKNKEKVDEYTTGQYKDNPRDRDDDEDDDDDAARRREGLGKIWKIWSVRERKKYVFLQDADFFLVEGEPYDYSPHAALKHHENPGEFYPIPPLANLKKPQDEYNDGRDMQRIHRKRSYRRYTAIKGRITDSELEKLEGGGDNTIAWASAPDALVPVQDAQLDRNSYMLSGADHQDFDEVAGSSMDARGGSGEGETATQANIKDKNMQVRESKGRYCVGRFIGRIIKLMLMTLRDNMQLDFWVQVNADPRGPNFAQEAQRVEQLWQQITYKDLGDFDFDVSIDVESMAPPTTDLDRNAWTQVLAMLANPQLCVALGKNETLLRHTLKLFNIRNEDQIQSIKLSLQEVVFAQMGPQVGGFLFPELMAKLTMEQQKIAQMMAMQQAAQGGAWPPGGGPDAGGGAPPGPPGVGGPNAQEVQPGPPQPAQPAAQAMAQSGPPGGVQ